METETYRTVQRSLRALLATLEGQAPNPRDYPDRSAGYGADLAAWQRAHDAWAKRARAVEAELQANGRAFRP